MYYSRQIYTPLKILLLTVFLRLYKLATVPFGWHPDEATKALLARDVLAGKYLPVFFSAFTGREALFVYLEALFMALMGEGIFIGRLLAAFIGLLTVALTFSTSRLLFNRRIGLLTAVFLSLSLWHLIASRNGYRAVIQPLIQLPVIYLLFRGLQLNRRQSPTGSLTTGNWGYFLLAGVFLGLTQYTYTAVRLFPFLIVAIVFLALLFDFQNTRRSLPQLALLAVTAFLVFLPLGLYFWQNPDAFLGRAAQISVFSPQWSGGDPTARLWQSLKETARMWTIWGDINFRFNVSGQPVFDLISGLLFFLGIPLSLWRAVRHNGLQRVAYLTLPLWLLIMLLPMILSAESLPYYQRAIGALPAVYFFPAVTLDTFLRGLEKRSGANLRARRVAKLLLMLFFGWLAITSYRDYFVSWHNTPRNDDDRRVAMVYVADYLQSAHINQPLYLSTQYMQHPTLALLAPDLYDGIHWFDARQSLPLPPQQTAAAYILLSENAPQPALLARANGLERVETGFDRFGRPVFEVYRWPNAQSPLPGNQSTAFWSWATTFPENGLQSDYNPIDLPANFGDVLEFVGYDGDSAVVRPGDTIELLLHWQLLQKPARQYTFFAHLLNADGQVVAGFDANEYPTSFWREDGGERLLSYMPLAIPPEAPPGMYQVEIGVYNQASGERLAVLDGETAVADRLLLAPLTVE